MKFLESCLFSEKTFSTVGVLWGLVAIPIGFTGVFSPAMYFPPVSVKYYLAWFYLSNALLLFFVNVFIVFRRKVRGGPSYVPMFFLLSLGSGVLLSSLGVIWALILLPGMITLEFSQLFLGNLLGRIYCKHRGPISS